jgi:CubicO group peptidase (beta-lactamase class C family)
MSDRFDAAIAFSQQHEIDWSRKVDENWGIHRFDPPPWNKLLGPVHDRGPASGAISKNGRKLVTWGEPDRPDLTFSVVKTYLALLAGVAQDQGLFTSVHEPVCKTVPGAGFDDAHNVQVTWAHLLQNTSEWRGEVFGLPDSADHFRSVIFAEPPAGKKGEFRQVQTPGSYWEYNDVRINQLSFALLNLFRRPLPDVFREHITRPCGASDDWSWKGYDTAWTTIDGVRMQSVPGGTHWGGGMSISANDQLRIAEMLVNEGRANGRAVVSAEWVRSMQSPCALAPFYGYLTWLNTGRKMFADLPESSYFAVGAGGAFMWMDPQLQLAAVVRWLNPDAAGAFFAMVLAAVQDV